MIVLKVKDYCHNCPKFECKVQDNRETFMKPDPFSFIPKETIHTFGDVIITCAHNEMCEIIEKHLKEQVKK